jgi:micrococcal nuclease
VAVATASETSGPDRAVVERVVDGDTLDVTMDGAVERIRLLNVDTPETVDPSRPVECLGPEATAFLKGLLPPGTPVTLEYDDERHNGERILAAVFTGDGRLVNAEVARQGLAATMVIGGNDRFYPEVEKARDEAVAAGRGLYSPDIACTVPAQVRAVTTATGSIPALDPQATPAQLDAGADAAGQAAASAVALEQAFAAGRLGLAWTALPAAEQQRLTGLVAAGREKAQRDEVAARTAAAAARDREAAAARAEEERREQVARERAERQRRAARERSRAAAEEKARADARRATTSADKPVPGTKAPPRPDPKPKPASGGGPAGYTGPRCYAPGGKTWKPC